MRVLEFEVKQQRLRKQPGCDFSHIVAGTSGYLKAKFNFSPEWDGCKKAASFVGEFVVDECAVMLDENNCCDIPADVLRGGVFRVCVGGVRDDCLIRTNTMTVKQEVYVNG